MTRKTWSSISTRSDQQSLWSQTMTNVRILATRRGNAQEMTNIIEVTQQEPCARSSAISSLQQIIRIAAPPSSHHFWIPIYVLATVCYRVRLVSSTLEVRLWLRPWSSVLRDPLRCVWWFTRYISAWFVVCRDSLCAKHLVGLYIYLRRQQ